MTVDAADQAGSIRDRLDRQRDQILAVYGVPAADQASREVLTVVIPTRGRADSVTRCVRALLAGTHQLLRVLVVDNDRVDLDTELAVKAIDNDRVLYVQEHNRGVSAGRNRGLLEASTALVAFLDDDTEPALDWAATILAVFAADAALACLTGEVLAASLDTAAVRAADEALGWGRGPQRRRFALHAPPADSAIFPFAPGLFCAGPNFAVRRGVALRIGGFDEALGAGTRSMAGEDVEFFVRILLAGLVLTYEPALRVRHHHRESADALAAQLRGYNVGLGAYLTKIALDRRGRREALRRLPAAVRQLRSISARETAATDGMHAGSTAARLVALASGPVAYLRARHAIRGTGRSCPPLTFPHAA